MTSTSTHQSIVKAAAAGLTSSTGGIGPLRLARHTVEYRELFD